VVEERSVSVEEKVKQEKLVALREGMGAALVRVEEKREEGRLQDLPEEFYAPVGRPDFIEFAPGDDVDGKIRRVLDEESDPNPFE
jgi:hypothetical protein